MAKGRSNPAVPVAQRCQWWQDSTPNTTDAKRAFEYGRGGLKPPAWVESNHGMRLKYQGGWKQRQKFVKAMLASGKDVRTAYELSLAETERLQAEAEDALLEQQMEQLKAIFAAQGLTLTREALAEQLRKQ